MELPIVFILKKLKLGVVYMDIGLERSSVLKENNLIRFG